MKKYRIINILLILIYVIFVLPKVVNFYFGLGNEIGIESSLLNLLDYIIIIWGLLNVIVFSFLPVFIICSIIDAYNKVKEYEKSIPKIDDITYFRDRVGQISPAVIFYILKKKIPFADGIMATLYTLKQNGYIEIKDNKIILKDKLKDELGSSNKYVLDFHKWLFNYRYNRKIWLSNTIYEAEQSGYIKRREKNEKDYLGLVLIGLLGVFSMVIATYDFLCFPCFLFILNYGIIEQSLEKIYKKSKYVKTEKGQELYVKLIGLKKFLQDFSLIGDSKKEELMLWEDYMIYAIIFDLKGILDRDVHKQYRALRKNYKIPKTIKK